MGLEKAKSLLPVKDGKTFLDLIAEQVVYTREKFGSKVRFILMNRYTQPAGALLSHGYICWCHTCVVTSFGSCITSPEGQHVAESTVSACSFSTSEDTKAYLSKSHGELIREEDAELLQNKSPKVDAATMAPISWPKDPSQEWYSSACLLATL